MPLSELPRMKELLKASSSSPRDAEVRRTDNARMRAEAMAAARRAKQRQKAATAAHARVTARRKT
jgi:hypothetical protein